MCYRVSNNIWPLTIFQKHLAFLSNHLIIYKLINKIYEMVKLLNTIPTRVPGAYKKTEHGITRSENITCDLTPCSLLSG